MSISGKAGRIIAAVEASDEPIFVLRGQDIFATMAIVKYLEIIEAYAPDDSSFQEGVANVLQRFKDWQKDNIHRVRYPD